MDFVNKTSFPAQAFQAIDQFGQEFHVLVARQTFSFASGELRTTELQRPLCASDTGFDDSLVGSVEHESDYAPFKPRCDVIVNAVAHPPEHKNLKSFAVRMRLWRNNESRCLIDKELTVHGRRVLLQRAFPIRAGFFLLKWCALTLLRPCPWRIKQIDKCKPVPVRYESAYGGECLVMADQLARTKVPKKFRLNGQQIANHPEAAAGRPAPIAHRAYDPNPCGTGFAQEWYLRATRTTVIEAPAIEHPDFPLKAKQFQRWLALVRQSECEASSFRLPAGFGILPKTHPMRRTLVGTVDDTFIASAAPLPENFDFAMWQGAPADQQIDYPTGGEEIDLANLCAAGTPSARTDDGNNTYLRLRLPTDRLILKVRDANDNGSILPMVIDTIIIEPEQQMVSLVWRRTIPFADAALTSAELCSVTASRVLKERIALNIGSDEASHDGRT
ncbi:hypothetical protein IP91_01643 [Pseudoduganella lurida]|uniref:DUF2169 domain-containing protein n=1 Tax=Pseudoduganella lurida TaxID=1036180 RepID=A0A562RGM1_9BURK|nr:DUF2169 domain-containing protein [Pseudoduganella lurida]TWI67530.1 hypothetical protein IP91_01643 [Pseudoduganella lurida]